MKAFFQRTFESLVLLKERVLCQFFELPGIRRIFHYMTPNQLCYFRIFASLIILWLFVIEKFNAAWWFFIFAAFTDFIDGALARWKNQVTEEGKNLDPIADKVLITIPLLIIGSQYFDKQTIAFFLTVELLLVFVANALKPYLRSKFDIPLSSGANAFGQIKMFVQTVTIGILLYNPKNVFLVDTAETMLWVSIVFGIFSFLRHLARMDYPISDPKKRIITIPNIITISALFLCLPAGFALARGHFTLAFNLLLGIFLSDWIDGWIAKRLKQETHFGAVVDPLRNYCVRFLTLIWFLSQIHDGLVTFIGLTTAVIEIVVALVNAETATRCKTLRLVTTWGKLRGFVQYIVFAIILATFIPLYTLSTNVLQGLFCIVAIASLFSLLSYVDQRRQLIMNVNQTAGQV